MKKMIIAIAILTTILLFVTKSLYVQTEEFFIIIGSLSIISIIFNQKTDRVSAILGSSSIIGFLFCLVFGLIDLIADHFLYFLPTANEDGMPLSLAMIINQYNDDLIVGSLISMAWVSTISVLISWILTLTKKKNINL
ncbi:hypothetical protein [Peribacillus sp. SCS-155]|uniref:hypothetical protein n=1 Tax=Peribacillus sedimenti TaxID=3115297 RepID=UPI003905CAF2